MCCYATELRKKKNKAFLFECIHIFVLYSILVRCVCAAFAIKSAEEQLLGL